LSKRLSINSPYKTNYNKMGDFPNPQQKKPINLLRGWPHPSLLPTPAISKAAQTALSNPSISTPGLLYGPDPGYQPLREEIAKWLSRFYGGAPDADRICITGGASQNLACVLQVYSDPVFTKVWMVAPSYYLACRIFDDSGMVTGAVPEGGEGVDLEFLERKLEEAKGEQDVKVNERIPSRCVLSCISQPSASNGKHGQVVWPSARDEALLKPLLWNRQA
jgi:DNA-binding transcriptional MocR family regulator